MATLRTSTPPVQRDPVCVCSWVRTWLQPCELVVDKSFGLSVYPPWDPLASIPWCSARHRAALPHGSRNRLAAEDRASSPTAHRLCQDRLSLPRRAWAVADDLGGGTLRK